MCVPECSATRAYLDVYVRSGVSRSMRPVGLNKLCGLTDMENMRFSGDFRCALTFPCEWIMRPVCLVR